MPLPHRCLALALILALILAQPGCAARPAQRADAGTVQTNWACRELDNAHKMAPGGGFGAVASVLVVWSALTSACLVSRI